MITLMTRGNTSDYFGVCDGSTVCGRVRLMRGAWYGFVSLTDLAPIDEDHKPYGPHDTPEAAAEVVAARWHAINPTYKVGDRVRTRIANGPAAFAGTVHRLTAKRVGVRAADGTERIFTHRSLQHGA